MTSPYRILIIGYGTVGQNMHDVFPEADIHDPFKGYDCTGERYDIAFVCVPTDMREDGSADTSIVRKVVDAWCDDVEYAICIKSTVPPGTTEEISNYTGAMHLCMSPEYYGATQHANAVDYGFVIIGGPHNARSHIAEAYKYVRDASLQIHFTDSLTAELTKYMENSWLATKVAFCNEFYRLAAHFGSDYEELRKLWLLDPRVNPSHTFVYTRAPYYASHCLSKDIPAIITAARREGYEMPLLGAIDEINTTWRDHHE